MNAVPPSMVDVMYSKQGQIGAVAVVSTTYDNSGRPRSLGSRANGDLFQVPLPDVIARPDLFLAPCGKPYIVNGGTIENPCGENAPASIPGQNNETTEPNDPPLLSDSLKEMTEAFGTEAASKALVDAGVHSLKDAQSKDAADLEGIVGKQAMNAYNKWSELSIDGRKVKKVVAKAKKNADPD